MRLRMVSWFMIACLGILAGCSTVSEGIYGWPNNTRPHSYWAALGDLDGDGDLDAYLANGENEGVAPDTVWFNNGKSLFTESRNQPDNAETHFISLGDLDGDGDPDGVVENTGAVSVAGNDGKGSFSYSKPYIFADDNGSDTYYPALGDLDGDGDLDLALGGCCGSSDGMTVHSADMVWLNDGAGNFSDSGQRLGEQGTGMLALGDLDGDGDLDLFAANSSHTDGGRENRVWLNDGMANFTDSGQRLGQAESNAVALGDLDGDGDLDAFVGNRGPDSVWINDGSGKFTDSGQRLADQDTRLVSLSDLNGDGDLDAFTWGRGFIQTWANAGDGTFEKSGWIKLSIWEAAALGDLDGDGDADIFAGLLDKQWRAWRNEGIGGFEELRVRK